MISGKLMFAKPTVGGLALLVVVTAATLFGASIIALPGKGGDTTRRLVIAGWIEGGVIDDAGLPVPDGTFVGIGFDGGPTTTGRTTGGRYRQPLLGIQDGDRTEILGLQVHAGSEAVMAVRPDRTFTSLDIRLTKPILAPTDVRDCSLILGSVSGRAPSGARTVKVATTGGLEAVQVTDGWYEVPSVGVLCSGGALRMGEMRFEGREDTYIPTALVSRLDLG